VNAVIEINVVRKIVELTPHQRTPAAVAVTHRFEQGRVGPDLRMAVHAGLGWRDAGIVRSLDGCMAVAAIDAEAGDVVLVAEGTGWGLVTPW